MLVILVRLAASMLPMPADAATGLDTATRIGFLALQAICHADPHDATPAGQTPSKHGNSHAHDCGLCPICHALAAPALLPVNEAELGPLLTPRARSDAMPPPATGPPAVLRTSSSPRGPPSVSV